MSFGMKTLKPESPLKLVIWLATWSEASYPFPRATEMWPWGEAAVFLQTTMAPAGRDGSWLAAT